MCNDFSRIQATVYCTGGEKMNPFQLVFTGQWAINEEITNAVFSINTVKYKRQIYNILRSFIHIYGSIFFPI